MTADSSNVIITLSGEYSGNGGVSSPSGGSTLLTPWSQVVRRGIQPDSTDQVTAVNSPVQSPFVDSPAVFSPVQSPIVDSPEVNSPVQSQFMDSPVQSQFVDSQAMNSPVQSPIVDSPAVNLPVQSPFVGSPEVNLPSPSVYLPVQSSVEDLPAQSVFSPVQSPEVDFPATAETQPEVSDGINSCNGGGEVRSVWSKPLANGVMEGISSPVINDSLWPALSESTRTGVKAALSVSTESSPKPDTVSQAPVIPQPPQKQLKSNLNPNHIRQRATRRGGSTGGAPVNYNRPPLNPPPFPLFDINGNLVPAVTEFPQPSFKTNNWSPRSSNKNPARRNNLGSRPVNIGYSGRRDHRGPPGPLVRGFVPPPFIPYQSSLRPYLAPIGSETGVSYVYVPVPPVPHGAIPYWESSLHGSILKQIEYYFSDENLVKDNFLRSHMDDEGWVPITLIAGFQRVKKLTNDLQMILRSLAYSNTVEIQVPIVFLFRADWRRWIHVPREVFGEEASFQKLKLEVGPTNEKLVVASGE